MVEVTLAVMINNVPYTAAAAQGLRHQRTSAHRKVLLKELEMSVLPFPPNEKTRFFLCTGSRVPNSRTNVEKPQICILVCLFLCDVSFYLPVVVMSQTTDDHGQHLATGQYVSRNIYSAFPSKER